MAALSPQEWGEKYRAEWGTYESLTERLRGLVKDLLKDAEIDVIQIEARTKEIDSFTSKIARKGAIYKDPLAEMTDIVGLRVITYYLEDVDKVAKIIRREFTVDDAVSVDKAASLDPDRFGYVSVHLIAELSPSRQKLVEWKQYAKIKVEIQVRTALQHAWSAVNHKLDYKSPTEVPRAIRRRLFRLNALFELADDQFSELRDARTRLATEYAEDVRDGQLNIPLDEASLAAYLHTNGKIDIITRLVVENGGKIVPPDERRRRRDRGDLVRYLNMIGISRVMQFDEYLAENVFPVPFSGTLLFAGYDQGIEDALTQIIMIDKRVDKKTFAAMYAADVYEEFRSYFADWHVQKSKLPKSKA